MKTRHSILTAVVAAALACATAAEAKPPRGKPAAKPASAAPAATPGPRSGAGQPLSPRAGTPAGTTPGSGPRSGMMHVKPGHNPGARFTFNVPAKTRAGAPRTTAGSATAARPNTARPGAIGNRAPAAVQAPRHAYTPLGNRATTRDTRRDAGTWRPVTPAAVGSRGAARDTRRNAGRWPAVNPATPAAGALKPPAPPAATRRDARPAGETTGRAAPQTSIQQLKSSKNATGDGRTSTKGQGPKPAADNARQLADFMLIQSTMQQQRAPKSPEQ